MGVYKYIRDLWKQPKKNLGEAYKEKLMEWRNEPVSVRIARPTRLDRARSIGYKAKYGYILVRQRLARSARRRPDRAGGRRSKHARETLVLDKNYQQIAEERANKKYMNLEVLGSYFVAKDGKSIWYEILLVDPQAPQIKADNRINWITGSKHKGRTYRGKTSAGRRSRGLLNKGKGAEKVRPSKTANLKSRNKI